MSSVNSTSSASAVATFSGASSSTSPEPELMWTSAQIEQIWKFLKDNPVLKNEETRFNTKNRATKLAALSAILKNTVTPIDLGCKIKKLLKQRQDDEQTIIEFYGENASLYDQTHKDYQDTTIRRQHVQEVSEKIGERISAKLIPDVWNTLRTRYNTEKGKDVNRIGQAADQVYQSNFIHYEAMKFLDNGTVVRLGSDNLTGVATTPVVKRRRNVAEEDEDEGEDFSRSKGKMSAGVFRKQILAEFQKTPPAPAVVAQVETFSVTNSLSKLNPYYQELAKLQIQTVLAEFIKIQEFNLPLPRFVVHHENTGQSWLPPPSRMGQQSRFGSPYTAQPCPIDNSRFDHNENQEEHDY